MKFLKLGFLALLVAGCATPEQRAEKHIARYGPYCEKLGYKSDTDQWRECVQKQAAPRPSNYVPPRTCNTVGGTTTCY